MQRVFDRDVGPPSGVVLRRESASEYVEVGKDKFKVHVSAVTTAASNVIIGTPPTNEYWFIERVFVRTTGTTYAAGSAPFVFLLIGDDPAKGIDWSTGVDFTDSGDHAVADNFHEPWAAPGEEVKLRWTGVTIGDDLWGQVFISRRTIMKPMR